MKKIMLIVMAVGCILVGTVSQGGAGSMKQLSREIGGCLCGAEGNAFREGCRDYMVRRLQANKTPDEAVARANKWCDDHYGLTKPGKNAKCKEGVNFLRSKE
jgi:hypothetical protein